MKRNIIIAIGVIATSISYWLVRPTLISQVPQAQLKVSNLTLSLFLCIVASGLFGAWLFRRRLAAIPSKKMRQALTGIVVVAFGMLFLFVLSLLGLQTRF